MKKFILAILALSITTLAHAEGNYAGVKFETRNGLGGGLDSNVYSITAGQNINQFLDAEVYARVKSNDDDSNNTRLEGALVGKLPLTTELSAYVRGAVGEKFDGTDNFAYWSVEPGVKYQVTNALAVKTGLRFRDAFNSGDQDSTRTWKVGAEYAITKNTVVSANIDRSYGDSEFVAYGLGYGVKF